MNLILKEYHYIILHNILYNTTEFGEFKYVKCFVFAQGLQRVSYKNVHIITTTYCIL